MILWVGNLSRAQLGQLISALCDVTQIPTNLRLESWDSWKIGGLSPHSLITTMAAQSCTQGNRIF